MDIFHIYFDPLTGRILNFVNFYRYNYDEVFNEDHLYEITNEQYDGLINDMHNWKIFPANNITGEIVEDPIPDIPDFIINQP